MRLRSRIRSLHRDEVWQALMKETALSTDFFLIAPQSKQLSLSLTGPFLHHPSALW
jgi:hypothetical protein